LVYWLLPPSDANDALRLRGVILGTLVMALGGFIDDRWELKPLPQFAIQGLGAAIAMSHIIFIEVFSNPLPWPEVWQMPPLSWLFTYEATTGLVWIWRPLALLLTLLWLMGMINAVNWLDGLDGLAAGVCAIAALLFAWHSYHLGQVTVALFPLILAGALLGFLPFNFAPARIFFGDGRGVFVGLSDGDAFDFVSGEVVYGAAGAGDPDFGWGVVGDQPVAGGAQPAARGARPSPFSSGGPGVGHAADCVGVLWDNGRFRPHRHARPRPFPESAALAGAVRPHLRPAHLVQSP
jgi:hypothetical protein